MKKIYSSVILIITIICLSACNDWLDREQKEFIDENKAFSSKESLTGLLTDFYRRLPDTGAIYDGASGMFLELDESMCGNGQNVFNQFPNDYWSYYDYVLIRDINTYLSKVKDVNFLSDIEKTYYIAEARFLRAYVYFEMVKRMGGIPLITEVMLYDTDGDITDYQKPRNKESEIYDFIASEIDEIHSDLAGDPNAIQFTRASQGAALALKSRAMLYAASLAKYNNLMLDPITLPGQEVGIPAERAEGYYKASLKASQDLINLGIYGLYDKDTDKKANYSKVFTTNISELVDNNEAIFIKSYKYPVLSHKWTSDNLPRTFSGGGSTGNLVNPSLNLVDAFNYLDGTPGKLRAYVDPEHPDETAASVNNCDANPESYIYYNSIGDIFANKDNRLFGSIMVPGSSFMSTKLDIRAGIAFYNQNTNKFIYYELGSRLDGNNEIELDGVVMKKTGYDGPSDADYITRSGFYVRKYMDENVFSDGESEVSYIRFRYAEILLNAAEAAFELGGQANVDFALKCINQLRKRAGFITELEELSLDIIRNERRIELAFEGHRFYDIRRWRIGEELWDGSTQSHTAMLYGLWPYQVYRPGHETHEKWIFMRRLPARFTTPRRFARVNYYSAFNATELTRNPKLIKNPGH